MGESGASRDSLFCAYNTLVNFSRPRNTALERLTLQQGILNGLCYATVVVRADDEICHLFETIKGVAHGHTYSAV